jgi:hypothetical protein
MRPLRLLAVLGLTLPVTACGTCEPQKTAPVEAGAPSTTNAPSTSSSVHITPILPHRAPQPKLACRIVALDGEAHIETPGVDAGTTPLLLQGLAPTDAWMALGKGSRVIARDPRTTRETTFRGPGRARACVDFSEESWLTAGAFESSVGAGESPGAEEWVITPIAVVRYAAAKLTLTVGKAVDATLESGSAFVWQPGAGDAALEDGWLRLPDGKTHLAAAHEDPPSASVDRCTTLAGAARALAAQVMAPGGAVEAGLITQQVTARRMARAACALATMRVSALPPAEAAPLLRGVAEANSAWSGVPLSAPSSAPSSTP